MLFLQFMLYSSSFVGTLKNEIPEAALELCQLKIKQLSPDILKFRTKHEGNPFSLNCSVVPRCFLFVFHAGSSGLCSNNYWNSSYKEKTAVPASVSRLSFRFLWLFKCISFSISPLPKYLLTSFHFLYQMPETRPNFFKEVVSLVIAFLFSRLIKFKCISYTYCCFVWEKIILLLFTDK